MSTPKSMDARFGRVQKIWKRLLCGAVFAVVLLSANGCGLLPTVSLRGSDGPLAITAVSQSIDGGAEASTSEALGLTQGIYRAETGEGMTVVLIDGAVENPVRAAVVRVYWRPRGASTPVDPNALNAGVTLYDLSGDAPIVYRGAGFVFPTPDPFDDSQLKLDLWDIDLIIEPNPNGENDGSAALAAAHQRGFRMTGRLTASRDDSRTGRQLSELSRALSQRLGRPHFAAMP